MKEDITHAIPSEDDELIFICPQCGSDRLYAVQEVTGYTEIESIDAAGVSPRNKN